MLTDVREKIVLRFPDGTNKELQEGITPLQIAETISKSLARESLAAVLNGKIIDLTQPIRESGDFRLVNFDDPEGKYVYWHSTSHVMAHAIEEMYPDAKFGVGPPIENGFYYDIDIPVRLTEEDLGRIEDKMKDIVHRKESFLREELPKDRAIEFFKKKGDPYKLELLAEIDENNETISLYREGSFTDLCRGPHLPGTEGIKHFKLLSVSGSYWRGDSERKMLQRIYGISAPKKKYIDEYLINLEEAKRRDHRRLGKDLELFVFHDISPGAPFWLPGGMVIFRELEKFLREELDKEDYQEISTPILVKKKLWEQSGHWDHYHEFMFSLSVDNEIFSLKPMNCPESTYIYRQHLRSYKDLPLRFSEIGRLHRNEISGALGGLFRVRQITMDDAHIYVRPDQILEEIKKLIGLINKFYGIFGFVPTYKLATRPQDSMGDPKLWDKAEEALEEALKRNEMKYSIKGGDGAFYGPKIDIEIKDVLGRSWQLATIQLDFQMPERFELEYVNEAGNRERPVIIHRAVFGSFERFIGILIEHFGGAFPLWLSPIQAVVLPITDSHIEYAQSLHKKLKEEGIRIEIDIRNEKVGYKIREWEMKKVPYMLVVGDREQENESVSVRKRSEGDKGSQDFNRFLRILQAEISAKKLSTKQGE